jgi:capsid protein
MHNWQPDAWQYTNPIEEAQAALLEIDMGINCPQNVAAALGRDYGDLVKLNKMARDMKMENELPIIHSTMTRHPQSGVGATGDPLGVEQQADPQRANEGTDNDEDGQGTEKDGK